MQSESALFDCQKKRQNSFTEVQLHLWAELLNCLYWTPLHLLKGKQNLNEIKEK